MTYGNKSVTHVLDVSNVGKSMLEGGGALKLWLWCWGFNCRYHITFHQKIESCCMWCLRAKIDEAVSPKIRDINHSLSGKN